MSPFVFANELNHNLLKSLNYLLRSGSKVNNGNYEAIERFLVTQVCKPLKMSAVQFDQLLFRNESAIRELLSCDATVVHDGPCLATSGSSSCGTGKRPVAAKMDRRRRLR